VRLINTLTYFLTLCMLMILQEANGGLQLSSSADDDDDVGIDELLMLSDVDASLQSLSLKHHLAVRSVRPLFTNRP